MATLHALLIRHRAAALAAGGLTLAACLIFYGRGDTDELDDARLAAQASEPARPERHHPPTRTGNSEPAQPLPAQAEPVARVRLATARFGEGADKLGIERPAGGEGVSEGPGGFLPLPDGRVVVADTLHRRLVWLDPSGRVLSQAALSLAAPQDLARGPNGELVVLDRWKDGAVQILSADGHVIGGYGLPGAATSGELYVAGTDVYVETADGQSRRVGDVAGKAADATTAVSSELYTRDGLALGRVAADGRTQVSAGVERGHDELVVSAVTGNPPAPLFTKQFRSERPLIGGRVLGSDAAGVVYLAVTREGPEPVSLLCLDSASGTLLGAVPVPRQTGSVDLVRYFQVRPEGGVAVALGSDDGVSYELMDCG